MISGTTILLLAISALVYFLFLRKPKWKNLPPGPSGFPIVGNLFQLSQQPHGIFSGWADKFGPIFSLDMMGTKMVVVSDHKMVKEMFSESVFSGRQGFKLLDMISDGKLHGIVNTEGEHWEEVRRFTLRQLRDFGFGKNTMEEAIMLEVRELIERFKEEEEKKSPLSDVKERLLLAVVNSLWFISVGKRHPQNDKKLLALTEAANSSFNEIIANGLIIFLPWLAEWFPKLSGYHRVKTQLMAFADYFRKPIEEHKATYSEDYQRDFTDVFLKEIKATTNPNSAFMGKFGEDQLLGVLGDLYFAGTDTTSSTLSWLILYLSKHPEVQKKFQKEIEEITGNTRSTSVADRPNMPYTEAVIAEILRVSSITPQGLSHRSLGDKEFHGYMIPKDTLLTANFWHIHHDPKIWGDPENFRPERFLSPDGKTFTKHEAVIAFSIGRRQCLGETLARDSLFLFSTNIFQRFNVEFDKNGPNHGYESTSFILTPKPFNVLLTDRLLKTC